MVLLGPDHDSTTDGKSLEQLENEITTLAAHIHAATHRLLILIAEFDRRDGWKHGGHRTCAHWLSYHTGIDLGAAREKVRAARALAGLPETSASMARGELSFSKVRALTRVANKANEGDLLEVARGCTTAQLERVVRSVRRGSRKDEATHERERFESRSLSVFPDYEGMYVVRGRLPAEAGALLMRAVEAASDALYRQSGEQRKGRMSNNRDEDTDRAASQRRADALGLLAEVALAVGLGSVDHPGPNTGEDSAPNKDEGGSPTGDRGEASMNGSTPAGGAALLNRPLPISGTRADRYQVILHVEPETLRIDGEGGRSELEGGSRVSAETSQRISCDAGLVRIFRGRDGSILDVGRRTRTIPPSIRRALEARDRGCRFPGCGSRFAEGHHIHHWADGGETKLHNLVLLCRHHHRLVHEGGWRVAWSVIGDPVFFDPQGKPQSEKTPRVGGRREAEGLASRSRSAPGVSRRGCPHRRIRAQRVPQERAQGRTHQESIFG